MSDSPSRRSARGRTDFQGMTALLSTIELWASRNIPYSEIRACLSRRSDADCDSAAALLCRLLPEQRIREMIVFAHELKSSDLILNEIEPTVRSLLAQKSPGLPPVILDQLLEVQALMVEKHVREANLFASAGGRN